MKRKKCTKCGRTLSLKRFNRCYGKLRANCKNCDYLRCKKWLRDNPGYQRRRYQKRGLRKWFSEYRKKRKKQTTEIQRRCYVKNRHKERARQRVKYAIKHGQLKRPRHCMINNKNCSGKIHAHHIDYRKPLEVVWLCNAHHEGWHRVFKTEDSK